MDKQISALLSKSQSIHTVSTELSDLRRQRELLVQGLDYDISTARTLPPHLLSRQESQGSKCTMSKGAVLNASLAPSREPSSDVWPSCMESTWQPSTFLNLKEELVAVRVVRGGRYYPQVSKTFLLAVIPMYTAYV